ncbi:hypothetical protein EMIT079MI2_80013 [Bacillus sp. IT-79MI2]
MYIMFYKMNFERDESILQTCPNLVRITGGIAHVMTKTGYSL